TENTFDAVGNLVEVDNGDGEHTYYAYDKDNRLTAETDALTHSEATSYDPAGKVTDTTDDRSKHTTYTYSYDTIAHEMIVKTVDPMVKVTTSIYDAADEVSVTIEPKGDRITYTYDTMGRLASVKQPDVGATTTTYDTVGDVLTVEDASLHYTN